MNELAEACLGVYLCMCVSSRLIGSIFSNCVRLTTERVFFFFFFFGLKRRSSFNYMYFLFCLRRLSWLNQMTRQDSIREKIKQLLLSSLLCLCVNAFFVSFLFSLPFFLFFQNCINAINFTWRIFENNLNNKMEL